jgi:hypothetical protein
MSANETKGSRNFVRFQANWGGFGYGSYWPQAEAAMKEFI